VAAPLPGLGDLVALGPLQHEEDVAERARVSPVDVDLALAPPSHREGQGVGAVPRAEALELGGQSEDGDCPEGFGATFTRFTDVHVGVITTSLGGHGGIACSPAEGSTYRPEMDDRGELVAPLRGVPTEGDQGFVTWQGHPWRNGTRDLAALTADVVEIVEAVGEMGCGYEAPLEAMYRFLVDPMPPLQVLNDGVRSFPDGLNTTLLEQRARFLRPDSAVGIVLLTDEDDCSVRDDGPGFYVTGATAGGRAPRGT